MDIKDLVKVSTYAKMIGKSTELVRFRIRTGIYEENKDYYNLDGVFLIDKKHIKKVN